MPLTAVLRIDSNSGGASYSSAYLPLKCDCSFFRNGIVTVFWHSIDPWEFSRAHLASGQNTARPVRRHILDPCPMTPEFLLQIFVKGTIISNQIRIQIIRELQKHL